MEGNIYAVVSVLEVYSAISGDDRGKEPPVHIPNTAVKLPIAEGTTLEAKWKNRALPDSIKRENQMALPFFYIFISIFNFVLTSIVL